MMMMFFESVFFKHSFFFLGKEMSSANNLKYAVPDIKVVDEVRACVLLPILPVCNPSRMLVNRIVPITSVDPLLISKNQNDPLTSDVSALDVALGAALDHHHRIILSQMGCEKGLRPKRERDGGSDREDSKIARRFFTPDAEKPKQASDSNHPFSAELMAPPFASPSALAVVEWANGNVSCTHDTRGLGHEEQLRLSYTMHLRKGYLPTEASPLTPKLRSGWCSDISAEQLDRFYHSDLMCRHRGLRDSRAMHSTLPPLLFKMLFEGESTANPPSLNVAAKSLIANYDAIQACRLTKQTVPPRTYANPTEANAHKYKSMDEDHDECLLLPTQSFLGDPETEKSIKALFVRILQKTRLGRCYLSGTALLDPNDRSSHHHLFSPSQRIICDTYDVIFYRNERQAASMTLFSYTLGHPLRPYGHRSIPFRLLTEEFEEQISDLLQLLITFIESQAKASTAEDDDDGVTHRSIISDAVNCAVAHLGSHLNNLRAVTKSALSTYVMDSIHRYVVVAVNCKMKRIEKIDADLRPDTREALNYLCFRVPYSTLVSAAISRILIHPDAATEVSLLPDNFWPSFAEEEAKILKSRFTADAVEKCKTEVLRMGRTHSYEEVNSTYFYK